MHGAQQYYEIYLIAKRQFRAEKILSAACKRYNYDRILGMLCCRLNNSIALVHISTISRIIVMYSLEYLPHIIVKKIGGPNLVI